MPWNPPIDWQPNQLVTAELMNEQVSDNFTYLRRRPLSNLYASIGSVQTSSTAYSFLGNGLSFSITPEGLAGTRVIYLVGFGGHFQSTSSSGAVICGVEVNGSIDPGLVVRKRAYSANMIESFSWVYTRSALNIGTTYNFRLMWCCEGTGYTLTATNHWHLWGLEVTERGAGV